MGGHCIGVDPYYLTHKAEVIGYHPQVILAGRRINDGMGKFIAEQTVKQMIACGSPIKGAKVNVLGLTFKEDVPDLRNSRAVDVIHELQTYGVEVTVHDPIGAAADAHEEYGIKLTDWDALPVADAVVVAVAHQDYIQRPSPRLRGDAAKGRLLRRRQGTLRQEGARSRQCQGLEAVSSGSTAVLPIATSSRSVGSVRAPGVRPLQED